CFQLELAKLKSALGSKNTVTEHGRVLKAYCPCFHCRACSMLRFSLVRTPNQSPFDPRRS
ncbi:unnamed protein product, partial [Linum tenue]